MISALGHCDNGACLSVPDIYTVDDCGEPYEWCRACFAEVFLDG